MAQHSVGAERWQHVHSDGLGRHGAPRGLNQQARHQGLRAQQLVMLGGNELIAGLALEESLFQLLLQMMRLHHQNAGLFPELAVLIQETWLSWCRSAISLNVMG